MKVVHVFSIIPRLTETLINRLPEIEVKTVNFIGDISGKYSKVVQQEEIEEIKDAEILIIDNNLLSQVVDKIPKVKWAQGTWAGVEGLAAYFSTKEHPKFPFTRMSNPDFNQLMAEYTVGWILNYERDFIGAYNYQMKSEWAHKDRIATYRSLKELTISILGIGTIGREIARSLKAFRATVHGLGRSQAPSDLAPLHIDEYWRTDQLSNMLEHSDYIVNVMPSTPETTNILGSTVLQNAKKCPVLINIGRGNIIKETDLIQALDLGWIRAAILDVFQQEPLPQESALWKHPKVIITPHVAGVSRASDVANAFINNWTRFNNSQPLNNQVDWSRGY